MKNEQAWQPKKKKLLIKNYFPLKKNEKNLISHNENLYQRENI